MPETIPENPAKTRWLWTLILAMWLRLIYTGNHVILVLLIAALIAGRALRKKDNLAGPIIAVVCAAVAFAMAVSESVLP